MIDGTPISESSKKKSIVTLSYCEIKYVVASFEACQSQWIDMLLEELKIHEAGRINLLVNKLHNFFW